MFLRLWTCKESVVKATGEGLYRDLRSFELRAIGTSRPQLSWRPDSTERTDRWRHLPWYVTSFVVDCDHVGALAMAGQEPIIRRLPVLCASSLEQSSALDAVLHVC